MLTDKIIMPEKQKKRCVDELIGRIKSVKSGKRREDAFKKLISDIYDALVKLPFPFQIPEAKRLIGLLQIENCDADEINKFISTKEDETRFKYICDIALMEPHYNAEADEIRKEFKRLKGKVVKILQSIDKEKYKKLIKKAGGINMIRLEGYMAYLT